MSNHKFPGNDLIQAYLQLSERYRQSTYTPGFKNEAEVQAYAAARMPATMAAVLHVLKEFPADFLPTTLLDLGAGTGAASLAALQHFSSLQSLVLVEQDIEALSFAQNQLSPFIPTHQIAFEAMNLHHYRFEKTADLVILSYVLNELSLPDQHNIFQQLLNTANPNLLILMPGTPLCFQQLLNLRQQAIEAGWFIIAPCPHHQKCPMAVTPNDWCHFKVRLPRSSAHRISKQATLNFEDEKFCYLLISKTPNARQGGRIVKNPLHRSGHSVFDVCEAGDIKRHIISRKDKGAYKLASKLNWGDKFYFEA